MKSAKVYADLRHRTVVALLLASLFAFVGVATTAARQQAQAMQKETQTPQEEQLRGRVTEALDKGDTATANKLLWEVASKKASAAGPVSGSVFFEEIKACGFYPQETRLACVLDIKQNGGYGGPIESFGSTEHVYFCVDWNGNGVFEQTESVGQGSVVMHDASARTNYAVYRDINIPGGFRTHTSSPGVALTETRAPILNAQATLSWVLPPTGCNFSPVWGNVFRFRIRLDPIR
ncbi:MAG TPA: hypothetical protein VGP08_09920 [Pyrinomonadaceae bacterium]|jgi:hypothetical protein|nr:hypothetical protein [Pyrinomonadaceae bacterium]